MSLRLLCLWAALLVVAGCATLPKPALPLGGVRPVMELCRQYALDCRWDAMAETIMMDHRGTPIKAMIGSDLVMVGNESVKLSVPLLYRKGVVFVPADFEQRVLASKTEDVSPQGSGRQTVFMIDAGHGGKDPGAIGFGGLKEKELNLDIAKRVSVGFVKAGIKVIMTRSTDEFVSLEERTALASRPEVELFISLHANANSNRGARGVEVYYAGLLNKEDLKDPQRRINLRKACEKMSVRADARDVKAIVDDMLYASKLGLSPGLADAVASGFGNDTGARIRGSKIARFFVLRNTLVPAILIETGFLTNPREARLLKDNAYRQKIADAIVKNVLGFWYAAGM